MSRGTSSGDLARVTMHAARNVSRSRIEICRKAWAQSRADPMPTANPLTRRNAMNPASRGTHEGSLRFSGLTEIPSGHRADRPAWSADPARPSRRGQGLLHDVPIQLCGAECHQGGRPVQGLRDSRPFHEIVLRAHALDESSDFLGELLPETRHFRAEDGDFLLPARIADVEV